MVDIKENYKFDLGVRWLKDLEVCTSSSSSSSKPLFN